MRESRAEEINKEKIWREIKGYHFMKKQSEKVKDKLSEKIQ